MPVYIKGSCVHRLNQTYYQSQLSPAKFITCDSQYSIYFDASNQKWILAHINPVYSMYNIHYYICEYNPNLHYNLSSFKKQPPIAQLGWKCIAAHSHVIDITIEYSNHNHIKSGLCIFAKQIIIEPNNIVDSGYIVIRNNTIFEVGKTTSNTKMIYNESTCNIMQCDVLCPGLIDIHTHGIGGHENVLWYYTNPQYTASKLPMFGTTSFLSTVVFSDDCIDETISMCSNQIAQYIHNKDPNNKGAICEGIHCEGPIISDFGGLPDSSNTTKWSTQQFEQFIDALNNNGKHNNVRIMTISPSIDYKDNFAKMEILKKKGIVAALGHDKHCTEEQIIAALSLFDGIHMTHCFNVQTFHHRDMGLANFALTPKLPNLKKYNGINKMPTIEIIGDLSHISALLIEAILQCHSPNDLDRIVFITDGIAEPVSNKKLFYNNRCIHVDHFGKTVKNENDVLCGSCCDMMTIFRNLVNIFNVDIDKVVAMTSTNAANIIGLIDSIGTLKVGTRADMILMDENLNLLSTIINGNIVYKRN